MAHYRAGLPGNNGNLSQDREFTSRFGCDRSSNRMTPSITTGKRIAHLPTGVLVRAVLVSRPPGTPLMVRSKLRSEIV